MHAPRVMAPVRRKRILPTERTLRWLRKQGYIAAVVERRIPNTFRTRDLFGFADILAIGTRTTEDHRIPWGALAVQATSAANLASRIKKVEAEPNANAWLRCGNRILVVGWALKGKVGTRKLWTPNVHEVKLEP